jgi:hypothetical protein
VLIRDGVWLSYAIEAHNRTSEYDLKFASIFIFFTSSCFKALLETSKVLIRKDYQPIITLVIDVSAEYDAILRAITRSYL